jgi:hypothetical protein
MPYNENVGLKWGFYILIIVFAWVVERISKFINRK